MKRCWASDDRGGISWLAILETLVATASALLIAAWHGDSWHVLIGCGVAPLLLLRSPESVALARKYRPLVEIRGAAEDELRQEGRRVASVPSVGRRIYPWHVAGATNAGLTLCFLYLFLDRHRLRTGIVQSLLDGSPGGRRLAQRRQEAPRPQSSWRLFGLRGLARDPSGAETVKRRRCPSERCRHGRTSTPPSVARKRLMSRTVYSP